MTRSADGEEMTVSGESIFGLQPKIQFLACLRARKYREGLHPRGTEFARYFVFAREGMCVYVVVIDVLM